MKKILVYICFLMLLSSSSFSSDFLTAYAGYGVGTFEDSKSNVYPISAEAKVNFLSATTIKNISINGRLGIDTERGGSFFVTNYGLGIGYNFNKISPEIFCEYSNMKFDNSADSTAIVYGVEVEYTTHSFDGGYQRDLLSGRKYVAYRKLGFGARAKTGNYSFNDSTASYRQFTTLIGYIFIKFGSI